MPASDRLHPLLLLTSLILSAFWAAPTSAQTLFTENFTGGLNTMTSVAVCGTDADWFHETACADSNGAPSPPDHAAAHDMSGSCTAYADGDVSTALESPAIDVSGCSGDLVLRFDYLIDFEEDFEFDRARVEVDLDGGGFTQLATNPGDAGAPSCAGPVTPIGNLIQDASWHSASLSVADLSASPATAATVRFLLETGDGIANDGQGFFVDDVEVACVGIVDLALTKGDAPDPVVAGTNLTYTLGLSNDGSAAASMVTVTDTVPMGSTFVSASVTAGSGWLISAPSVGGTGDVVFSKALVAGAEAANFEIVVAVGAGVANGTIITNTATAAIPGGDSDPANDTAMATTTVAAQADLALTKSDSPDPVNAGEDLTYALTVTNAGPSNSTGGSITTVLPSGVAFSSSVSGCTEGGGTVTCPVAAIAPGGNQMLSFMVTVDPGQTIVLSKFATVTGNETDPVPANNTSPVVTTTVVSEADLAVTKTNGVASAVPGETVTYTIVASNNGPSDDPAATLTDIFPADLTCTYTSVAAGGASGNTAAGSGDLVETLSLPVGSSVTYTANCTIDPSATGTLSNTATIASSVTDPTSGNNSSDSDTELTPESDLSITKVDDQEPVIAGTDLTYTVTASNAGPSVATGVTVTDTLPAGVTLVSTSGCAEDPVGVPTCSLGTLAPGDAAMFIVVVTVASSTTGVLTNVASVASEATDPIAGNDSTSEDTTVSSSSDIVLTKTDGQTGASPGDEVTYTITVSKAGPSDAPGTEVTDTFPVGLTSVGWTCTATAGSTCTAAGSGDLNDVADLAAGGVVTYLATGTLAEDFVGDLENTATATPGPGVVDGDLTNNTDTDTTSVTSPADLTGSMVAGGAFGPVEGDDGGFAEGDPVIYTVTLVNSRPTDQLDNPGPEFVNELPLELSLEAASADSGVVTIDPPTGTTTWDGVVPGDGVVVITIETRIDDGAGSTIENQGEVFYDADGDGTNESSVLTDDPSIIGRDDPTVIMVLGTVEIPTLGGFGMLLLALAIGLGGLLTTRSSRRRT